MSVPQVPSMNFGANEGMIADLLKGKNDLKTLQENYDKLKSKLDSFRLSLSDSTNNINKDSLKNELIEQLELQQQFLESLPESTDILGQSDLIPSPSESMRDALDKLEGEYSKGELIEILERTQVFLTESFKQRMMVFVEGINLLDLPNNLSNADLGGTAAALFEAIGDGFNVEDLPTDWAKQAVSGRINRKVGFEEIGYSEINTQNKVIENKNNRGNLNFEFNYMFNKGQNRDTFFQNLSSFRLWKANYISFLINYSIDYSQSISDIAIHTFGLGSGIKSYFYQNWFYNLNFYRNQSLIDKSDPKIKSGKPSWLNEFSIGLGKEIQILNRLHSSFKLEFFPVHQRETSINPNQFNFRIGLLIDSKPLIK